MCINMVKILLISLSQFLYSRFQFHALDIDSLMALYDCVIIISVNQKTGLLNLTCPSVGAK